MHVILADAWGPGFHAWFILFPLFWFVLFLVCFRFFAWRRGPWMGQRCGAAGVRGADPNAILAELYARGEITHEQYQERLGNLRK